MRKLFVLLSLLVAMSMALAALNPLSPLRLLNQ